MFFDECLVNLRNIAQKIATGIYRVVPDASYLSLESLELILHLDEFHIS